MEKVTKRAQTLEEVNINVKLLAEMLSHYDKDTSSDSDKEIIKVCVFKNHEIRNLFMCCCFFFYLGMGLSQFFLINSFVFSSQELFERCDKLRITAFKIASETEDDDASLGFLDSFFYISVSVSKICHELLNRFN